MVWQEKFVKFTLILPLNLLFILPSLSNVTGKCSYDFNVKLNFVRFLSTIQHVSTFCDSPAWKVTVCFNIILILCSTSLGYVLLELGYE